MFVPKKKVALLFSTTDFKATDIFNHHHHHHHHRGPNGIREGISSRVSVESGVCPIHYASIT